MFYAHRRFICWNLSFKVKFRKFFGKQKFWNTAADNSTSLISCTMLSWSSLKYIGALRIKPLCPDTFIFSELFHHASWNIHLSIEIHVITITRLFKYIENFTTKKRKLSDKNSDIFHISAQNIDCGYSLEPPRRGGSNEHPQSMF